MVCAWRERAEVLRKGMVARVAADVLVTGRWKRAEMTALATTLVLGGARSVANPLLPRR